MDASKVNGEELDGYGIPFDPARHLRFVLNAKGDESFNPPVLDIPVYSGSLKEKPAGWFEGKGSGI